MLPSKDRAGVNHPLAIRMGAIAFVCQTVAFGCMWGAFGVLLAPVEARLHVSRELSSLAVPVVLIVSALLAPTAGVLTGKISLRLLMMFGAALSIAGFSLLALSHTFTTYILAYALLVGPGYCLCGIVLPSTLVARWFQFNRGRALGFVNIPIMIAVLPLLGATVLGAYGVSAVYAVLAGCMVLALIPMLFVVDFPPSAIDPSGEDGAAEAAAHPAMTTIQLLREPIFWVLTLTMSVILSANIMFGTHLVPMARSWGFAPTAAAGLMSLSSTIGMAGSLAFGWLADKVGGRMALTINCVDNIVLWGLLLLPLPFPALAVVASLIGFHGVAPLPLFAMALSERFGQGSFARAYGLGSFISLPFVVVAAPLAAAVFVRTGSYGGALAGYDVLFALTALMILVVGARRLPRLAEV